MTRSIHHQPSIAAARTGVDWRIERVGPIRMRWRQWDHQKPGNTSKACIIATACPTCSRSVHSAARWRGPGPTMEMTTPFHACGAQVVPIYTAFTWIAECGLTVEATAGRRLRSLARRETADGARCTTQKRRNARGISKSGNKPHRFHDSLAREWAVSPWTELPTCLRRGRGACVAPLA